MSETVTRLRERKFRIREYDRKREPMPVKNKEGQSVGWGVRSAIKNSKIPPDVVYHKGDFGKEPMIIVFGKTPSEIMEKISKII